MGKNSHKRRNKYKFNLKSKKLPFQNDVQYLQHCKNQRFSDPRVSAGEIELLNKKVRLNDGTMGYVFTISKLKQNWIYTCHICKAKHMTGKEFNAHAVGLKHLNRMKMSVHLHHKFILKDDKSFTQTEEIVEEVGQTVCEIQKTIDEFDDPLVGLEYLLELVTKSNHKYFCLLCSRSDSKETLFIHLTNSNHHIKFFTMFFPSVAKKLKNVKNRCNYGAYIKLCTHLAACVERVYGRLKPRQMESKDFSHSSKGPILEKIDKGKHIRETKEPSLVECVDTNHLKPGVCPVLGGNLETGSWLKDMETSFKEGSSVMEEWEENIGNEGFEVQQDRVPLDSQSFQDYKEGWARNNRSTDGVKRFDSKSSVSDEIHRQQWPVTHRNTQYTSSSEQREWNDASVSLHKQSTSSREETYSRNILESYNMVSVLRELLTLENYLGSLGPKVQNLLLETIRIEKFSGNSTNKILSIEEHYIVLETVKEKLIGFLEIGVIEPRLADVTKKITFVLSNKNKLPPDVDERTSYSEEQLNNKNWSRTVNIRDTPLMSRSILTSEIPHFVQKHLLSHLSFAEKERLSSQACLYLSNQGKYEIKEDELLKLMDMLLSFSYRENSNDYKSETYRNFQSGSNTHSYSHNDRYDRNSNCRRERSFDNTARTSNSAAPKDSFNSYLQEKSRDKYGYKYHRHQ